MSDPGREYWERRADVTSEAVVMLESEDGGHEVMVWPSLIRSVRRASDPFKKNTVLLMGHGWLAHEIALRDSGRNRAALKVAGWWWHV